MKFAFFDVDNTIYNGYTANDLFPFLNNHSAGLERIVKDYEQAVRDYTARKINYNEASQIILDLFSLSLKNIDYENAMSLVTKMLSQKDSILNLWVNEVVEFLRNKGFRIILVSAGPDTIVSQVAKVVEADEFFATEVKMKDFVFTGEPTILLNEDKKSELIHNILSTGEENITVGFGDSTGDIPMLELTQNSFVVKNDHHEEMMDYAKDKKWNIFDNASQVLDLLKDL